RPPPDARFRGLCRRHGVDRDAVRARLYIRGDAAHHRRSPACARCRLHRHAGDDRSRPCPALALHRRRARCLRCEGQGRAAAGNRLRQEAHAARYRALPRARLCRVARRMAARDFWRRRAALPHAVGRLPLRQLRHSVISIFRRPDRARMRAAYPRART
ncbi:hypothetical protein KXW36_000931, partial [Aspergillus fumigatus]